MGGEEAHLLGHGHRLDEVRPAYLVQPVFVVLALDKHRGLHFGNGRFVPLQLPEALCLSYEAVRQGRGIPEFGPALEFAVIMLAVGDDLGQQGPNERKH